MRRNYFFKTMFAAALAVTFTLGAVSCDSSSDKEDKPEELSNAILLPTKMETISTEVVTSGGNVILTTDITETIEYTYSEDSLLMKVVTHLVSFDSKEVRYERTMTYNMEYNQLGELVKVLLHRKSPYEPVPIDYRYEYTHNEEKIYERFYASSTTNTSLKYIHNIVYNKNNKGQCTSAKDDLYTSSGVSGSSSIPHTLYSYEYDAKGNIERAEYYAGPHISASYEYDDKKNFVIGKGLASMIALDVFKDCTWVGKNNWVKKSMTVDKKQTVVTKLEIPEYNKDGYPKEIVGKSEDFNLPSKTKSEFTITIEY